MNEKLKRSLQSFLYFKGILMFLFLLFLFHFSWKIVISGDMPGDNLPGENILYLFGKGITFSWLDTSCRILTKMVAWFIHLFPNTQDLLVSVTRLKFPTEGNVWINIVWGCLGFKQMFIYSGIILCYWGPLLKKLWYIPVGCVILTAYNIVRIASTVWLTNGNPERFEMLHDGILRYIYYTIVFILWVVWAEFIDKNNYSYAIRSRKNSEFKEINAE